MLRFGLPTLAALSLATAATLNAQVGGQQRSTLSARDSAQSVTFVAHRGGIVPGYPENTVAAFRHAIELGVHMIEIDRRGTADGEIVIMHDETVDRTTNGQGEVTELTLPELKQLDAGDGQRIPTYVEVLELVAGTGVELLLDIKESPKLDKRPLFAKP